MCKRERGAGDPRGPNAVLLPVLVLGADLYHPKTKNPKILGPPKVGIRFIRF